MKRIFSISPVALVLILSVVLGVLSLFISIGNVSFPTATAGATTAQLSLSLKHAAQQVDQTVNGSTDGVVLMGIVIVLIVIIPIVWTRRRWMR